LLYDNAKPCDTFEVVDYLTKEGITIVPPYSLDLSPCNYWQNDSRKRDLRNQNNVNSRQRAGTNIGGNIPDKE